MKFNNEVELGDAVVIRKTLDCPIPGVNTTIEFKGVIKDIKGNFLLIDCGHNTLAMVHKKHVVNLEKKVAVKR